MPKLPPPLTCRQLIAFLVAYLEGELTSQSRAVFEAHLAACSHCVDYLASYRETLRVSRRSFEAEARILEQVPPELVTAILAARPRA